MADDQMDVDVMSPEDAQSDASGTKKERVSAVACVKGACVVVHITSYICHCEHALQQHGCAVVCPCSDTSMYIASTVYFR